ncbi:hypothetical protein DVK02_10705 [Halobellus sp. Atlit-31R]|nr:hypothetical protein DVK02_10705 [Halobellus sp. Atlit-31R]
MSRFRLYGSGGRPVYDSAGDPSDRRLDRIKREFNAGVAMFYDPGAGLVRGQVKIHRRSPEQFVATYQTDADEDLLTGLVDGVRRVVDRREWTVQYGIGGNQALFDALADGSAFDPEAVSAVEADLAAHSIAPDDLRAAVAAEGAVDLRVPDYATAAAALAYVREEFPDYAVAVTESTDVETIAAADVFVRPAREVDRVSPGPAFAARLDRHRAAAAADAFERAVDTLATSVDADAGEVAPKLAATFDGRAPVSELDVRLVVPDPAAARRSFRRTLLYCLPGAILFGTVSGLLWPGGPVDLGAGSGLPLHLLGLAVGLGWLVTGLLASVARAPERAPATEPTGDEATEAAQRALDALRRLSMAADESAVRNALTTVLDPYDVVVEPAAERRRRRTRSNAIAAAVSAAAAGLALALVYFGSTAMG